MTTDTRGRFVFVDLEPGDGYRLTGRSSGSLITEFGWQPGASDALQDRFTFRLTEGEWKRDVALRLWRRGTITGRVIDEHGQPVVGVTVRAFSIEPLAGVMRVVGRFPLASTDDRGVYRLYELEPGEYKVAVLSVQSTVPTSIPEAEQAQPIGGLMVGLSAGNGSKVASPLIDGAGPHRLAITNFGTPPPPAGSQARAYPSLFYPGVRTLGDAQTLTVTWNTDRPGIDFQLQPVPAFVVAGHLESAPDTPLLLRLLPAGLEYLGVGSEVATTVSEKDGAFTFLNVPAGSYTLIGQDSIFEFHKGPATSYLPDPPGFPSAVNGGGGATPTLGAVNRRGMPALSFVRQRVSVGGDTSSLVIRAGRTGSIHGRVIYSDGALPPIPNTRLPISLEPADGDASLGRPSGYVDAASAFTIDGVLPGKYLLTSGRVISSVLCRGREIADDGFEIGAGETIDDIVVTFTGKPAQIEATVAGLAPDARAAVIAFPVAREQWSHYGWNPRRIASGNTNGAGTVTFARLPAGDYFVIAVEPSQTFAWMDPKFLAAAVGSASRVSVGWSEKRPVTLKVERVVVK